jgi:hypothetical protein
VLLLNKLDKLRNAWTDGVIPFTVKSSFMYIDFREIIIGDFYAFRISVPVKHTGNRHTFRRFVAPISETIAATLMSGMPCQFLLMKENRRCSIYSALLLLGFFSDVSGGL